MEKVSLTHIRESGCKYMGGLTSHGLVCSQFFVLPGSPLPDPTHPPTKFSSLC